MDDEAMRWAMDDEAMLWGDAMDDEAIRWTMMRWTMRRCVGAMVT